MTDKRQTLLDLAARVEGLTQSEREIDAEIACIIGKPLGDIDHWLHADDIQWEPTAHGWYQAIFPDGSKGSAFASMEYTNSLDAAKRLIPKGYGWLGTDTHMEHWAQIVSQSSLEDGTKLNMGGPTAKAGTLPLALCSAALRARAMMEGQ